MSPLDLVMERIEQARLRVDAHHIVKLVAVSKYSNSEDVKKLYAYGQRAFGENRVQDLEEKCGQLAEYPLEWHFMGNLQTNKINKLIDLAPDLVQSISSLELAQEMQKRLEGKNAFLEGLLQINSAREATKGGVDPDEAIACYQQIRQECPNIILQGVMTIGAHVEEREVIKQSFEITHALFETLRPSGAHICSMGMSSDFELAIECGSNMVRLGSVLFK